MMRVMNSIAAWKSSRSTHASSRPLRPRNCRRPARSRAANYPNLFGLMHDNPERGYDEPFQFHARTALDTCLSPE